MIETGFIRVEHLAKTHGRGSTLVHALRGVSFSVQRGERIALLGKSGSGKSTLLHLLGGLDRPTSGRIWFADRDLAQLSSAELARHRQTTVGLIFQAFYLVPSQTALANVELPLVFAGISPKQRESAARRALEAVGLADRARHRPAELSGGERQRVAIARALVNRPQVVLADEPTGNLDTATATTIMALLDSYVSGERAALCLVTHDEELARRYAQRILRLRDGQLANGEG